MGQKRLNSCHLNVRRLLTYVVTPCTTDPIWLVLSSLGKPYPHRHHKWKLPYLSLSPPPLSGRGACQTTLSSLFMPAACQGPSVLICLPIPPIPMIFFSTFKSFFHPCSLACLHPFLKKAASCRESRHKLLTFPPPRNSRAILSP